MQDHRAVVDALIERLGHQLPAERLLDLFEAAFGAIWRRACVTLGDVTLTAIVNRVLYSAVELHPSLSTLRVAGGGIDCGELRRRLGRHDRHLLEEGLRYVLVELLTVIGSLTAEILTPALHEALSKVTEDDGWPEPVEMIEREQTYDY